MTLDFARIAPYLRDPLVLVGFVLFLGFLFARRLLDSGIIGPVGAGRGAAILRLLLHYGFVIGVLVILLGFGLKYRDLSTAEQQRAIGFLLAEIDHDLYVANELKQNTDTLTNAAKIVADSLRRKKLKINYLLFPADNIDGSAPHDAGRYNVLFSKLLQSGLLHDKGEVRRFFEQCAAIRGTIDRTLTTVRSLADSDGHRYVMQRAAYDANLPILRKIDLVPLTDLASLYAKADEQRQEYFRVSGSVVDYLQAVDTYCDGALPDRATLGATLAAEKLSFQLLLDHAKNLNALTRRIARDAKSLKQVRVAAGES